MSVHVNGATNQRSPFDIFDAEHRKAVEQLSKSLTNARFRDMHFQTGTRVAASMKVTPSWIEYLPMRVLPWGSPNGPSLAGMYNYWMHANRHSASISVGFCMTADELLYYERRSPVWFQNEHLVKRYVQRSRQPDKSLTAKDAHKLNARAFAIIRAFEIFPELSSHLDCHGRIPVTLTEVDGIYPGFIERIPDVVRRLDVCINRQRIASKCHKNDPELWRPSVALALSTFISKYDIHQDEETTWDAVNELFANQRLIETASKLVYEFTLPGQRLPPDPCSTESHLLPGISLQPPQAKTPVSAVMKQTAHAMTGREMEWVLLYQLDKELQESRSLPIWKNMLGLSMKPMSRDESPYACVPRFG